MDTEIPQEAKIAVKHRNISDSDIAAREVLVVYRSIENNIEMVNRMTPSYYTGFVLETDHTGLHKTTTHECCLPPDGDITDESRPLWAGTITEMVDIAVKQVDNAAVDFRITKVCYYSTSVHTGWSIDVNDKYRTELNAKGIAGLAK